MIHIKKDIDGMKLLDLPSRLVTYKVDIWASGRYLSIKRFKI
jgi:hypothetical protein